jgi:S-adenosylmethionine decarboxylase
MKIFLQLSLFLIIGNLSSFAEEAYDFHGIHFLASYCECDETALKDLDSLRETMLFAAEESGATVLKFEDYIFPPDGFTMAILLSESHASIHTYPEHRACFVDLFTCGESCSSEKFAALLEAYLKPQKAEKRLITRNELIQNTSL